MASAVLLFKNIFFASRKEENEWFSQATFYLASALRRSGTKVVLSSFKFSDRREDERRGLRELDALLAGHPEINIIGLSLCEDFFEKARSLIRFLRKRTDAFIGVGCVMPTLTPGHVFAHLPLVNFLVRGAGEEALPRLARILENLTVRSVLDDKKKKALGEIPGFLFRLGKFTLDPSLDTVNEPGCFDDSVLDFGLLEKENLSEGLNLFTSRGCRNSCFFCTSPGRGRFIARSAANLKEILNQYRARLKELYPEGAPAHALKISFNDDDFLADPGRALSFFRFLKGTPFCINFFQTGINSFFNRKKNRPGRILNRELLAGLSPSLFAGHQKNIYIGTENFCDRELARLGKGYGRAAAEKAVMALGEKNIGQVHHFIVSNQLTEPSDILENLFRIALYRLRLGASFRILTPVIPYLVSLFPSASYRMAQAGKRGKYLCIRKVLRIKARPEYDYPLVTRDIPVHPLTRELVPFVAGLFLKESDYLLILDRTLLRLLVMRERMKRGSGGLGKLLSRYGDYPSLLRMKAGLSSLPASSRLELVITGRTAAGPEKGMKAGRGTDMDAGVLMKSIDMLFASSRSRAALGFSGGEPLLRMDLVKSAVRYARSLSLKKRKSVSFFLTTGLSLITERIADYLRDEGFYLSLLPEKGAWSGQERIFSRRVNHRVLVEADPASVKEWGRDLLRAFEAGFRNAAIRIKPGVLWSDSSQKSLLSELDRVIKRFGPAMEKGLIRLETEGGLSGDAFPECGIVVDGNGLIRFKSDALLDVRGKRRVPPLGRVTAQSRVAPLPFSSPFRSFYRLLQYAPSSFFRKILLSNREINNKIQEIFLKNREKAGKRESAPFSRGGFAAG